MDRAKVDLDRRPLERKEQLAREHERQATREWWGNPTASSTITSVHSYVNRGVQTSRMEDLNGPQHHGQPGRLHYRHNRP